MIRIIRRPFIMEKGMLSIEKEYVSRRNRDKIPALLL